MLLVGFFYWEGRGEFMESVSEFYRISRTLYRVSWLLLGIIAICTAVQYGGEAGRHIYLLVGIYGMYLYYQMKYHQTTSTGYFIAELLLILFLDWAGRSHIVVYLLLLLILRRVAYSREPNIYIETLLAGALYIGGGLLHGPHVYYDTWLHTIDELIMIGLAVLLVHPAVQLAKSLQDDRKTLRLRLNKAEESYQLAVELALRDGLTGLYNYRALQEHIGRIGNTGFAILLIDVDHFKEFNDRYGHLVGDQALIQIGQIILENVRRSDKVYRYGGEEFAVLLEDTDDELAKFTAERIRLRVADKAVECCGRVVNAVTISIGVATFLESKTSCYQMLEHADKALYAAKAKGRNNVVFFMEPTISI